MSIVVSKGTECDWEGAMELAWRVYLKYVGPSYPKEGTESFLKFISGQELYKMFLAGEYPLYVAKDNDRIVGMATMRGRGHISLLFVNGDYHKQGIGRKLLRALQNDPGRNGEISLTVNASPYGIPFYKKVGFLESDTEKQADGIIYTPMTCVVRINEIAGSILDEVNTQ